jgi:hypothetical protein
VVPESFTEKFEKFQSAKEDMLEEFNSTIVQGISEQEENAIRWAKFKAVMEGYGNRALAAADIPQVLIWYPGRASCAMGGGTSASNSSMSGESARTACSDFF